MNVLATIALPLVGIFCVVYSVRRARRPGGLWSAVLRRGRRATGVAPASASAPAPAPTAVTAAGREGERATERNWTDWLRERRRPRHNTVPPEATAFGAEVREATEALLVSLEEELRAEWHSMSSLDLPSLRPARRCACGHARRRAANRAEHTRRRVRARPQGLAS